MIEGTKPYRPRSSGEKKSETPANVEAPLAPPASDATNKETPGSPAQKEMLDRRDWFRSLVPAFGEGLVKILRTSNNFQRDLQEIGDRGSSS